MSDFEICETLGSGTFASVSKCRKKSTGEEFAIKRLQKSNYTRRPALEASMPRQEHDTLIISGRHPNVCSLECAFETTKYWVLIIEFCDQGSIRQLIEEDGTPGLETRQTARLGRHVLQALDYLHTLDILHRDVKPENCGISSKPEPETAKLIDFGFAARVPGCQSRAVFGSYGYLAPEIELAKSSVGPLKEAKDEHTYDNRVDLYSFGVMLFVMLVGREASSGGKLWTHQRFRSMLTDTDHRWWTCRGYRERGIDVARIYPKLRDSGALPTISALTETRADRRPSNAAEACKLPLFISGDSAIDGVFSMSVV
jgi:serine/threonine protein kinase